jgi:hypothetical protein
LVTTHPFITVTEAHTVCVSPTIEVGVYRRAQVNSRGITFGRIFYVIINCIAFEAGIKAVLGSYGAKVGNHVIATLGSYVVGCGGIGKGNSWNVAG